MMLASGVRHPAVTAAGDFFFRYRNLVFPLAVLLLCALFPPKLAGNSPAADSALNWLGVLVVVAGQVLRAAVIGYAYIQRGGLKKKVYADKLVVAGFFAVSRNPLYLGNLLIYAGLFIVHNNAWTYLLGGTFFLTAYHCIVAAEERYLMGKFGETYSDYCRRVPRWWPDLARLPQAVAGMRFKMERVIAKDYSTATSWSLTLLLLLGNEAVQFSGWDGAQGRVFQLSTVAALILATSAAVSLAKRTRLIG